MMRTSRLSLAALALLSHLPGCRSASPEPLPALSLAPSSAPLRARDVALNGALDGAPIAAQQAASGARADDSSLLLGNPSDAKPNMPDNLLVERPQHAMSYNARQGEPNWVSWHVGKSDLGRVGRGTFRPDALLPAAYQIRPNDYRGSGYDRGHVCPSADRTSSREANDATFVMSNMLPQAPALNQQVWAKLEVYARSLVRRGSELYTVAGGVGTAGKISGGKINVPAACWKILLVLPEGTDDLKRIDAETRVITVLMPNEDTPEVGGARWAKYLTTVAQIEKQTGYRFFSALPAAVQRALKAKQDSGRASTDDAAEEEAGATARAARFPTPEPAVSGMVRSVTPEGAEPLGRSGEGRSDGEALGGQQTQPAQAPEGASEQQPTASGQVWVNTRSGVFHYPGTRWYGTTKSGEYMSESAALAHGYHAAGNGQ